MSRLWLPRFFRAFFLIALLLETSPGHAQQASFAGQRITIVVGSPSGGVYDAYARLVARRLGTFLPGNPGVIVQNMPGGGSLIAANWLANSAQKDGTVIATLPSGILFEAVLGNPNAHFDGRKMNLLSSLDDFTGVAAIWHDAPFMTARDLLDHEVLVGASGATSNNSILPNLLNSLIHTKFKIINGYPGSAGIALAMERGEVQAMIGDDWGDIKATQSDWLRNNKVRILLQATLKRHPELPDVPTALEFASPENRDVLALLIARQSYSGLFLAPSGVAPSTLSELRNAFTKMVSDPDFNRDAQQANLAIHATNGEEVTTTLGKLLASPQPIIARATTELRRIDPE